MREKCFVQSKKTILIDVNFPLSKKVSLLIRLVGNFYGNLRSTILVVVGWGVGIFGVQKRAQLFSITLMRNQCDIFQNPVGILEFSRSPTALARSLLR